MPLNLYATVNGFTTQEGTGDASPNNVREIKNAGEYNAIVTVDLGKYPYGVTTSGFLNVVRVDVQNVLQNMLFVEGSTIVFARSTWLPVSKTISDNGDYPHFRTGSTAESKNALVLYIPRSVLAGTTTTDIKNYLAQNPLSIMYKSTDDTNEFYTGIEITQGDEYRCEIIDLKDRLHDGDKVETNVLSEFDKVLIIDQNSAIVPSGEASIVGTSRRFNVKVMDLPSTPITTYGKVLCNRLPLKTASETYEKDVEGISIQNDQYSQNNIQFRVHGCKTEEEIKAWLTDNPLYVVYKSTSGGTGKNVRRETHVKKQYVFTGNEDFRLNSGGTYPYFSFISKLNFSGVLSGMCSHFPVVSISANNNNKGFGGYSGTLYVRWEGIDTIEQLKELFTQQYAAGTPVTIEYELAQPEVFADEPIDIPVTALEVAVSGEGESKITYRIEPKYDKIKTDWKVQPPTSEGYYNGDWFELEDYVRIYNNLQTVKDLVKSIYGDFTFPTMVTPVEGSPVFASQINILEEAIRAIRNKSIAIPEIPDPKTWTDNANLFTYEDINRWESVAIYYTAILIGVYELQPKLQFKLGGAQF